MRPSPVWLRPATSVLVVAAHPDDETLGFGGQLAVPLDATFLYLTDGAPRDMRDARANGFDDRLAYIEARSRELRRALGLTMLREIRIEGIGIADQEAAHAIGAITEHLTERIGAIRPDVILTHPFEGGHPDHDATAFAVRRALEESGADAALMEFAGYNFDGGSLRAGRFLDEDDDEVLSVELSGYAYDLKRKMIDCFETQSNFIGPLFQPRERFRIAPVYDFAVRPHAGPLFYETWDCGMCWERWLKCIEGADDHSPRRVSIRAGQP